MGLVMVGARFVGLAMAGTEPCGTWNCRMRSLWVAGETRGCRPEDRDNRILVFNP